MNREIKFRAWENENGRHRMFAWGEVKKEFSEWLNCKDTIVMQYTGLKDKNGVDIYEGDILKIKWTKPSRGGYFQSDDAYCEYVEIVVVEWSNISFKYKDKKGKYLGVPRNSTIEIIGNIYENPELV